MPEKIASYAGGPESRGDSFPDMFWDSLKPFPGRGRITLRLAVTCTLIVLVADTFRMPMQDLLPFFVLFVTKEEKVTTALSALLVLFAVTLAIGVAVSMFSAITATRVLLHLVPKRFGLFGMKYERKAPQVAAKEAL